MKLLDRTSMDDELCETHVVPERGSLLGVSHLDNVCIAGMLMYGYTDPLCGFEVPSQKCRAGRGQTAGKVSRKMHCVRREKISVAED